MLQSDSPRRSSHGLSSCLTGFSVEIPVGKVKDFRPDPLVFPKGSMVFLPHLQGVTAAMLHDACKRLTALGYRPVPHIAARYFASSAELTAHLDAARGGGADHVLVLAGDRKKAAGPFSSATELVRSSEFRDRAFSEVMIAGYPEGHPLIEQAALDATLLEKVELLDTLAVGCTVVSQFGFDASAYATWLKRLREAGVRCPVRIGIAGVTSVPALIRYAVHCGVGPSLSALRKRSGVMRGLVASYRPDELVSALCGELQIAARPDLNIHFFPFGGVDKTLDWAGAVKAGESK